MNLTRTGCAFLMLLSFAKPIDRKSTRLNSSHLVISYAVFCLKKKNKHTRRHVPSRPVSTTVSAFAVLQRTMRRALSCHRHSVTVSVGSSPNHVEHRQLRRGE